MVDRTDMAMHTGLFDLGSLPSLPGLVARANRPKAKPKSRRAAKSRAKQLKAGTRAGLTVN